jgi:hypothetical protein
MCISYLHLEHFTKMLIPIIGWGGSLFLISHAFRKSTSKSHALVALYCGVALLFGGCYFVAYQGDRSRFTFADEVLRTSRAKRLIETSPQIDDALKNIPLFDFFISAFVSSEITKQNFHWSIGFGDWHPVGDRFSVRTYLRAIAVGPQKDQSAYIAFFDIAPTGDAPNFTRFYILGRQSSEFDLSGYDMLSVLKDSRGRMAQSLTSHYDDSGQVAPFSIWDFYYFSFTIVGAADISATATSMRAIVVLQILAILLLASAANDLERKPKAKQAVQADTDKRRVIVNTNT